MRATVSLDDDLLRTAQEYSGLTERAALIREALKALIAGKLVADCWRWQGRCATSRKCVG